MIEKRKSQKIKLGGISVGERSPILIETMSRSSLDNINTFLEETTQVRLAGANIQRVAVNTLDEVETFSKIKDKVFLPVIADVHINPNLGIQSAKKGFAMVRVNPGNTPLKGLKDIGKATLDYGVSVRIGLNSGSLPLKNRSLIKAMEEETLRAVEVMEGVGQRSLMISVKDSDVNRSIDIYKAISSLTDYPLHIGLTEAGFGLQGVVKSVLGIGHLLLLGIGDTIRVSLTDGALREVEVGVHLLRSLGLNEIGVNLISCPGCGRKRIDILHLAMVIKEISKDVKKPVKIAVMGCEINGPGEAREADIGLAGTKEGLLFFMKGKNIGIMTEENALAYLQEVLFEGFSSNTSI